VSITDEVRAPAGGSSGGAGGQFDRTPPQDIAAEQSVLGGMLLSKDAIADVVEILRSADFYRPAHAIVFDAILDLYGRGEPADPVTLAAALTDAGQISRVGGAPYLHDLVHTVPTAANAAYYAKIVAERAVLRRLVEAGTRIVQLGYGAAAGAGRDVDDVVDLAQQAVYDVTERRVSEDFAALAQVLQPTLDEIEAIGAHGGVMTGVPTGFADLDRLLHGMHPGQLIVVAGRPGLGKSTASMDFVRCAAVRHGLASVIFSLEMSKIEVVMRVLSAEARVPLHVLRSGQLSDDDWTKLARRMGEISEAPLFIDDTPNMNLMEIRAKARRLRQRHDLKLIVVDYLQLMTSPKRVESRQQEVSELSRGLKLLAKEVECPVIAVSQLNRGPEQRTDKRPQLSDLRESGCLTAETRIVRADTNSEVTLGELLSSGARDVPVWALDERLRHVPRTMTHVFPSGRKEVFRLTLASGKEVDATANHPFLTFAGWQSLGELAPGTRIATPRHLPPPLATRPWPEPELILLAHLLGGGSFVARQPIRYASRDTENLRVVAESAKYFGVTATVDQYAAATVTTLRLPAPNRPARGRRNPIAAWLDGLGLLDKRSPAKFLPGGIFALPDAQVALFLRHLWAASGSVRSDRSGRGGTVYFASTSRRMAEDVSRLLLRFGINARLRGGTQDHARRPYAVDVSGREDQSTMLREIGVPGRRAGSGGRLREEAADLESYATNDVFWDEIREVSSLGERDVYDATVPGLHNFVANGVSVHNSIEQDADVVVLLHRDDYYDKESPRAGEADFIVAKHRNGPTDTVTVAAQLHLSRFVDMAIV